MTPRRGGATIAILVFALVIAGSVWEVRAQTYMIELQELTWDHLTLTILIAPSMNEPWWRDYFLNATLDAVDLWNTALFNFSRYDPEYDILSQVRLVPTVGGQASEGYDIHLSWLEVLQGPETIGTSQAVYRQPCLMVSNTVQLASRIPQGPALSPTDTTNAAVHELGHALGLSHTQTSGDIMYPRLIIEGPAVPVSTLDAYAVWHIVKWMDAPLLSRRLTCPGSFVELPSTVDYGYLTASGVLPVVNRSWSPLLQILETYIGPSILVVGVAIVVRTLIRWSRTKPAPTEIPEGFTGP